MVLLLLLLVVVVTQTVTTEAIQYLDLIPQLAEVMVGIDQQPVVVGVLVVEVV